MLPKFHATCVMVISAAMIVLAWTPDPEENKVVAKEYYEPFPALPGASPSPWDAGAKPGKTEFVISDNRGDTDVGPAGVSGAVKHPLPSRSVADLPSTLPDFKRDRAVSDQKKGMSGVVARTDKDVVEDVQLADMSVREQTSKATRNEESRRSESGMKWKSFVVKEGSTLSGLFKKAGLGDALLWKVVAGSGQADDLERIFPGEELHFGFSSDGDLEAIELYRTPLKYVRIDRTEQGFVGIQKQRNPDTQTAYASAVIDSSLYVDAREAGLANKVTMQLTDIFAWQVDFVYDVRPGDSFDLIYEDLVVEGQKVGTGEVLAARMFNRGEEMIAIRHESKDGKVAYYTPEGKSMEKAFLRTPINARVSSSFNLQRRHPVLDIVRPHEGTDYAAPVGTPIKSVGEGKVIFAGKKGGYGNTVVLKHGDGITTLYAHLNRIDGSIRNGKRVVQGDVVGYLGSTGMVTGPHLHYEFRVNGEPKNSRTIPLPDAKPVPDTEMAEFKQKARALTTQLATMNRARSENMVSMLR